MSFRFRVDRVDNPERVVDRVDVARETAPRSGREDDDDREPRVRPQAAPRHLVEAFLAGRVSSPFGN